jgi:hypothetical protein
VVGIIRVAWEIQLKIGGLPEFGDKRRAISAKIDMQPHHGNGNIFFWGGGGAGSACGDKQICSDLSNTSIQDETECLHYSEGKKIPTQR